MNLEKNKKNYLIMKNSFLFILFTCIAVSLTHSQDTPAYADQSKDIYSLVDSYALARETKDTLLLERILASEVDQLVSSGNWRNGKEESMKGMLRSSASNPGSRTLKIEKLRFLNSESAIADARYEIQNADGTIRKMWSSFIVVYEEDRWKISAIRNMLPARP